MSRDSRNSKERTYTGVHVCMRACAPVCMGASVRAGVADACMHAPGMRAEGASTMFFAREQGLAWAEISALRAQPRAAEG